MSSNATLTTPSELVPINAGDTSWVLMSTAGVFVMTVGLGFFYSGLARAKHALSLLFLMMVSIAVVSVQWWLWGFSLTFSPTGSAFIGNLDYVFARNLGSVPHPNAPTIPGAAYFLFQCMFAIITPALAFGATAERMRLFPALAFLFVWSTVVYDIITYWVWAPKGWLLGMGLMDYAGGTPVHMSSGVAAVAYAIVLGKRRDYADLLHAPCPHNVTFVYLGTALLWFGWLFFNGGSAVAANARAAQAIINSHLAACVGGIIWVIMDYRHARKLTLIGFCTGVVAGLATITPGSGFVSSSSSLVFGLIGGGLCNLVVNYKRHLRFDDALDVFAVHYVGGLIGLVLTGIFAQRSVISLSYPSDTPWEQIPEGGWLDGRWVAVPVQLLAIVSVSGWSFFITFALLKGLNYIPGMHLRVSEEDEEMGTDLSEMGEVAYGFLHPDASSGASSDWGSAAAKQSLVVSGDTIRPMELEPTPSSSSTR
ncbi:ammonium transporter AmtB-like domain-containing protein [Piptocephalis cylindrospora]|uniref:Ammonium transporter n=1 Tax=Piptocephalis cylindrospora TaxID=1907219 RepID=A0A4P9Y702_9FUNG|nr:ammonium transporter AmtB-like domain-containing protein [Piptocephalis cylindrospora]|eukprot:RKP14484.1 ammonium transporter AmtB-like domain-containing protein [Piptocephalis cylindrospora]